jgi:flagellar protein FlaJ
MGTYDNIIANMGYRNTSEFILKYFLPLMGVIVFFFLVALLLLTSLPFYVPFVLLGLSTIFVLAYPYAIYEKKKIGIEENLHLFITFAGTISTIDINRNMLFKKIAERKSLGEIAKMSERILYFSRKWNLGYSKSCRTVAKLAPSKIFSDFLDRLAIMLDFGESMDVFLVDEQDAIMDDYAANYKKALENIKTVQEVFVALTMAVGFMLATSLLLPLVTGTKIEIVVRYALYTVLVLDIGVLFFVKNFIPADKLCFKGDIVDEDTLELYQWIYVCFPLAAILACVVFYLDIFSFITNVAISVVPLFFVGLKAQITENRIYTREKAYPSFIRAFGTAVEVKSGSVEPAIQSLRVHDFGPLNKGLVALYRRLKTGSDKYKSWEYFQASNGSNLIHEFTGIFSESLFLGGSPQKVGEIISHNFMKILSLRKLRQQLASSLRGALYGALVGFAAAAFVSAKITDLLGNIFNSPFDSVSGGANPLSSVLTSVLPTSLEVNMAVVTIYITIIICVHSIVSASIIKIVDGGNIYATLFDICIMIWLGTIVALVIPFGIDALLPGFADFIGETATSAVG